MASPPPPASPSLTRSATATDPAGDLNPAAAAAADAAAVAATATWSFEQEARLAYCQDQLKQAQKKWSDRQELWIREVEQLLELKRTHKKAVKKQKSRAAKARRKNSKTATAWRPLSRSQSNVVVDDTAALTGGGGGGGVVDGDGGDDDDDGNGGDEEDEDEEGERGDSLTGAERRDSLVQPPPLPTSSSPTTTTTTGRNPFKNIIRRMSSAGSRAKGSAKGRVNSVPDIEAERG